MKIQKGKFYTIGGFLGQGHKGRAESGLKKGKAKFVTVTHHSEMKVRNKKGKVVLKEKTIPLKKNPQKGDSKNSYVAKRPILVKQKDIKKQHPEMQVKNSRDKSIFRNVAKKKVRK